MKDFRGKITNYKAVPSANAWSDFDLKRSYNNTNRLKKLNYLFFLLNAVALIVLLGVLYNSDANRIRRSNIEEQSIQSKFIEDESRIPIAICDSLSHELKNKIAFLQIELETITERYNSKVTKHEKEISRQRNLIKSLNLEKESKSIDPVQLNSSKEATQSKSNASLKTATAKRNESAQIKNVPQISNKPFLTNYLNSLKKNESRLVFASNKIIPNVKSEQYRVATGMGVTKDVFGRYGPHYLISIDRKLRRKFSLGLRMTYGKTEENVNYNLSENIKDYEFEISSHLFVRYNPIQYRNFKFNLDVGVGSSYFLRSYRMNRFEDSQLIYFNDANSFHSFSVVAGAVITYDLNSRFGFEVSYNTYSSEQQSIGFIFNYKF